MPHRAKLVLLLLSTALCANAGAQTSMCGTDVGKDEVSFHLSAPAADVKSGTKALITLTETNVSDHTVMIWIENTNDPGGLIFPIEVRDKDGKVRPEGHYMLAMRGYHNPKYFTKETPMNGSGGCIPLHPGESRVYRIEVGRLYDIAPPGQYSVTLVDHRIGHTGTMLSNTVVLNIVP